jgi:predicted TIM-barrel fold metal-dependent hydrolase
MTTVVGTQPPEAGTQTRELLIDTDVHESPVSAEDMRPFLPEHFQSVLYAAGQWTPYPPVATPPQAGARAEWVDESGRGGLEPELLVRHLFEEERVTTAILCGTWLTPMQSSIEAACAVARAYNDWQIEHWLNFDKRLRGSVHIVADDPEEAAKEIDRVAKHSQIVQVRLPTVTNRQYGDPRYRPIYEAAIRNDLPIALHHGGHTKTVLGWPLNHLEWQTVAAPQAGMNQIMSIIVNGTFDRYPELKVVMLETGVTWLPWFNWRLDHQYREARIEIPWVKKLPSEHMRDHVRIATQPMGDCSPSQFAELAKEMEAEHMYLFSTDYPHYNADSVETTIPKSLGEFGERVRWRNAVEFYPRLDANGLA